jgi:hypothetical protein
MVTSLATTFKAARQPISGRMGLVIIDQHQNGSEVMEKEMRLEFPAKSLWSGGEVLFLF